MEITSGKKDVKLESRYDVESAMSCMFGMLNVDAKVLNIGSV